MPTPPPNELKALTSSVRRLEHDLDQVHRRSATTAILAAGAALMLASLALPWWVNVDAPEFDESATIGWASFLDGPVGPVVGIVYLATLGLAVAAATSRSPGVSLASHVAATWVCGLPMLLLLCYGLVQGEVNRVAAGYCTALIAVASIALAAGIRRRQLRQM